MMRTTVFACIGALCLASLTGCPKDKSAESEPANYSEAKLAIDESATSSQAAELTSSSVELSTNFTIGGAAKDAAAQLRTFIGAQLPCADITLADATLTVKYGAKPGNCTYRGHTFSGETQVTVSKNETGEVLVAHQWKDFSNGVVKVSGTADVTWSLADKTRHVVHQLTWTRLRDGKTGTGGGDRMQSALEGGIALGFKVDGTRTWDGQSGHWELAIRNVEWRWADPVPQSGAYTLSLPNKKSLTMAFARVDDDRIEVTVSSGEKSFKFVVSRAGAVADS